MTVAFLSARINAVRAVSFVAHSPDGHGTIVQCLSYTSWTLVEASWKLQSGLQNRVWFGSYNESSTGHVAYIDEVNTLLLVRALKMWYNVLRVCKVPSKARRLCKV